MPECVAVSLGLLAGSAIMRAFVWRELTVSGRAMTWIGAALAFVAWLGGPMLPWPHWTWAALR